MTVQEVGESDISFYAFLVMVAKGDLRLADPCQVYLFINNKFSDDDGNSVETRCLNQRYDCVSQTLFAIRCLRRVVMYVCYDENQVS